MRLHVLTAVMTLGLALPAAAQTTTRETVITSPPAFPAERDVIVREYVEQHPTEPVIIQEGGTVRPGSIVPDYVPLRPFGGLTDPAFQGFRYFVSPDRKVVIVDPTTRTVVRILDL